MLWALLTCGAVLVRTERSLESALATSQAAAVASSGAEAAMEMAQMKIPHTIRRGTKGNTVLYLQQLLNGRNYSVTEDGDFGQTTERKVLAFQRDNGLAVDGVVGRGTWTALQQAPLVGPTTVAAPSPLPEVLERALSLGHEVWGDPWRLWLYGIRGPTRNANAFDDTLGAAYVDDKGFWHVHEWPGTTDPGKHWLYNPMRKEGCAILVEGQYLDTWTIAKHRGKYDALCQTHGKVRVYRDNTGDQRLDLDPDTIMTGKFGINLHASTRRSGGVAPKVSTHSAGCQVHASQIGFATMMELAEMQEAKTGRRTFSYTLLKEWRPGHEPPVSLHTIRDGAEGPTVKHLQQLLNARGYWCDEDADFGPSTTQAVISFQQDHGLTADGVVGRGTWAALQAPLDHSQAPAYLTGPSRDIAAPAAPQSIWRDEGATGHAETATPAPTPGSTPEASMWSSWFGSENEEGWFGGLVETQASGAATPARGREVQQAAEGQMVLPFSGSEPGPWAPPFAPARSQGPAAPGPLPNVIAHAHTLGHKSWGEPWRLWLFGIRHPRKEANSFDDTLGAAYVDDHGYWKVVTWPATTDPGSHYLTHPPRSEGTAILAEGQYLDTWTIDLHRGKYEALCQRAGPVSVYRDNSKDTELDLIAGTTMSGYFGINIHAATQIEGAVSSVVDKWSAGCQVHASEAGFSDMMDLARMQVAKTGRKTFSYTLMQQWW